MHYAVPRSIVGVLPSLVYFAHALILDGFGASGFEWTGVLEIIQCNGALGAQWLLFGRYPGLVSALLSWWLVWS